VPEAPADPGPAVERVAPFYTELGLQRPVAPAVPADPFADQLPAVLESGASVFSFTSGIPPGDALAAIRGRGMLLAGTATTVDEARALEDAGVDAVVAQGSEAGGHRGTFAGAFEMAMVGTMALVPQVADAVSIPVVASGGIMDGRGIAAALALGADAAQMGTAFLTCAEAGVADVYKDAIVAAGAHQTRLTRAFSGRPARGIVNRFMVEIEEAGTILPFPYQNALTRPMRLAAAEQGRAEFLSLWAGQGAPRAGRQPAAELVARLAEEAGAVIKGLAASA
jgi:nitronate monooxygenase